MATVPSKTILSCISTYKTESCFQVNQPNVDNNFQSLVQCRKDDTFKTFSFECSKQGNLMLKQETDVPFRPCVFNHSDDVSAIGVGGFIDRLKCSAPNLEISKTGTYKGSSPKFYF